ncbi:hypothetical protein [Mucilaginibacter sp. RCC_168]
MYGKTILMALLPQSKNGETGLLPGKCRDMVGKLYLERKVAG